MIRTVIFGFAALSLGVPAIALAQSVDPGPRPINQNPNTPPAIAGASPSDVALFNQAMVSPSPSNRGAFDLGFSVSGTFVSSSNPSVVFPMSGLGPRFNSFSCRECHGFPAIGGASRSPPGQATFTTGVGSDYGILAPSQAIPSFLQTANGSIAARLKYKADGVTRDGAVHQLFVIAGRPDAPNCGIAQEDWATQAANNNVAVRLTTPTFGAGLIEAIPDAAIINQKLSNTGIKLPLGITGHENHNGPGGTVSRFGWKAQTRTLDQFAAEAFVNEIGGTSAAFPTPNDPDPSCNFKVGLDNKTVSTPAGAMTFLDLITAGMRLSAPRAPVTGYRSSVAAVGTVSYASISNGQALFASSGCIQCHVAAMNTGTVANPALSNKAVNLYSDLLVHHMGAGLADDIIQGQAGPDEFRTAPLWGLGQRLGLMHDGRTQDLKQAIAAHASPATAQYPASEANTVVTRWNALTEAQKQDLLNFLRSL
jgi:CxxC motif-containing protein (DUF1111 family)